MAIPRRILPGRTYLLTRRCIDRRYLLKPSPTVDQILLYALAVGSQRFGIEIHGFVVSTAASPWLTAPQGSGSRLSYSTSAPRDAFQRAGVSARIASPSFGSTSASLRKTSTR